MKRTINRIARGTVFLIFGILCVYLTSNIIKIISANGKIQDAQKQLEALKQQNSELQKKWQDTQKQSFVEGIARDKLGLAREGEVVVVLPDQNQVKKITLPVEVQGNESLNNMPNWQKWLRLFK